MEIQRYSGPTVELVQEQKPLTREEKRILKKIRNKKLFFIGTAYAALLAVLLFVLLNEWAGSPSYDDKKLEQFRAVFPWFVIVLFVILTVYFATYYLRSVHPLVKDLKGGVKELIYFPAQGYKTPFFDGYYLETPSRKNARIRISKHYYELIRRDSKACMSISLHSRFVFFVETEVWKIEFNEKNARVDN